MSPLADEKKLYRQRLLNAAKACRESPHPEKFSMGAIMHTCGTPACALGHYAARGDLQDEFVLLNPRDCGSTSRWGTLSVCDGVALRTTGAEIGYDTGEVAHHFGLDTGDVDEIFAGDGCGDAKTANDAADYIENFAEEKYPEVPGV